MRVIAGKYRGRRVDRLDSDSVRPTLDRVKESLFSILTPRIVGTRVVDLFAGSGSLGIESLSRGACFAMFIDMQKECIEQIVKNIESLSIPREEYGYREATAKTAVSLLRRDGAKFDLVFVDPPYGQELVPQTLELLADGSLLNPGAWIVAEHHKKEPVPETCGELVLFRKKDYGDVAITFYCLKKDKMLQGPVKTEE